MRLSILAVLLFVATCTGADYKCLSQPKESVARPDNLLPSNYAVLIRTTDFIKSLTSETRETKFENTVGVIKQTRADGTMHWIFRDNDYMFYDGKINCTAHPKWSESPTNSTPYDVPKSIATALTLNATTVRNLLKQLKDDGKTSLFTTTWLDTNDTSVVGGVPTQHWVSCINTTTGFIEVDVALANSTVLPPDAAIADPVLLQIVMRSYDVPANSTNATLTEHYAVEISSLHLPCAEIQEKFLLPPKGVYCNLASTKKVPAFPDKFEIRLQYADISGKRYDTARIIYDRVNKMVGYELDVTKDSDEPFIGNISVGSGHVRVVHDFGQGLEYVLTSQGDQCTAVNALPRYAGDVAPGVTDRLELKNATDFMLGGNATEFIYLGQRTTDAGLPADVYIAKVLTNVTDKEQKVSVKTTVTELWYSLPDWSVESRVASDPAVTLLEIRQYHYNETAIVNRTAQKIQSFLDYTSRSIPWAHLSVAPCLKIVDDSYLFMMVKTSLANVNTVGLNNFEDGLAEHIAKIANVSVLRVVKNFVKEVKLDGTYVAAFFNLGDVSGVAGVNETSLKTAREAINKTISAGTDAEFSVFDDSKKETKFSVAQKALGDIPSTWNGGAAPVVNYHGYSGGSMFVLALFMLLIGGGVGVGVAFFLWKRQRGGGGLTYQVFE